MTNYRSMHRSKEFVAVSVSHQHILDIKVMPSNKNQAASAGCPECQGEPVFMATQFVEIVPKLTAVQSVCYCEACLISWNELCLPERAIVVIFDRQTVDDAADQK